MFEVKKYQWLLTELAKSRSKLKFLEVFFIRSDIVESGFYTSEEGTVLINSSKSPSIKEILEKFLFKRTNYLETPETQKPVTYMIYASYKKIASIGDVKDYLRKDQKLHNLKEIILFQEYQHDSTAFYTLELYYDGEGLVSSSYRRDVTNSESTIKDNKFLYITLNLSKYLVSSIENLTQKNVVRLKYDFVVDQNFCPIVMSVTQIKLVHPKIFALNKGINVDGLESLTIVKDDYKGLVYPKIPSVVKEPDPEMLNPVAVSKAASTSIFMSFISKFLGNDKEPVRKSLSKIGMNSASNQISPVPINLTFAKTFEAGLFNNKSVLNFNLRDQVNSDGTRSSFFNKEVKLPDLKASYTSRNMVEKHHWVFPGLKPNSNLSNFLKAESERLIESKLRRVAKSEMVNAALPVIDSVKKKIKRKKSKKVKKIKKSESIPRFVSPYEVLESIK